MYSCMCVYMLYVYVYVCVCEGRMYLGVGYYVILGLF